MIKWTGVSAKQDALTMSGLISGLAEAGWHDAEGVVEFFKDFRNNLKGLASLINQEVRDQLGEQIVAEFNAKINRIRAAAREGGDQNALQLGRELGDLFWHIGSIVIVAAGAAKLTASLGKIGVRLSKESLEKLSGLAKFDHLAKAGGLFAADGRPLMDFSRLTNAQKGVVGEMLGSNKVQQLLPEAKRIGRVPSIGQTGIDDIYKINKPGIDYAIVEYKCGSSVLKKTADGLQMSDSWLIGTNTGTNRILEAIGNPVIAKAARNAMDNGRIEKWLVHTDPYGRATFGILDKNGKLILRPVFQILGNIK
ncbi:Probable hemagglutinin-related protein [Mycoavidus cysteinexigens]|uniref:Probable hemagglutinin-related protein n=1 Tax=Mycoavidus cysteinexigens TaxID=1553431 RepID=A0A2Z6EV37_9BURK|nr:hypothetical protein [Mycoavidus cysteinexigens]BBE09327.1 Probable hemagglutinin-related protein [Mycoavidus cysteinexigens]GAM51915.1 hypothetical protein EBME_0378 [bacterium endosymbiont of Mortierella elongata FMR23-6]GLR02014.1 hypothetical protein GCM10007934_18280 [Mycoavidus cysteinexigens]